MRWPFPPLDSAFILDRGCEREECKGLGDISPSQTRFGRQREHPARELVVVTHGCVGGSYPLRTAVWEDRKPTAVLGVKPCFIQTCKSLRERER